MRSGALSFKLQAVGRDLRRFWPASALFGLFMLLVLANDNLSTPEYLWKYNSLILYPPFYGILCAILLSGDLFKARYTTAIHALPITRNALFLNRCLSGLALFLLPIAAAAVMALVLVDFALDIVALWAAQLLVIWLYGFTVGILACNLSGTVFGAIAVSLTLAFGIPLTEVGLSSLCHHLLVGICEWSAHTVFLSPIIHITMFSSEETSWIYYGAVALVSGAALCLAAVLYRKRDVECAGDFAAFLRMKPWIKGIASIMGGLCLSMILMTLMDWEDTQGKLLPVLRWLLPGVLLGRWIVEMLVEKTVRVVSKKHLLHYFLCLVTAAGVATLIWLDLPNAQTRVPDPEDVVSVEVNENYSTRNNYGTSRLLLVHPETIAQATKLHRAMLEYRDLCITNQWGRNVTFHYTLKDGSTMTRQYLLKLDSDSDDAPHPTDQVFSDFVSNRDIIRVFLLGADFPLDESAIYMDTIEVLNYRQETTHWLTPQEADGLLELLLADIENGDALLDFTANPSFGETDAYYGINIRVLYAPDSINQVNYSWVYLFNPDSAAVQWLETHLPRTR